MNDEVGPLGRIVALERFHQKRRAHRGVEDHPQARFVGLPTNGRQVQHITVRIAGRLQVQVGVQTAGEAVSVLFFHLLPTLLKGGSVVASETFDRDIQVGRLTVPIVNQLMRAAVDVAADQQHVAVP